MSLGPLLPVQVPHQRQAVLCPREKVAAVISEAEACEVLVVSVQDGQEVSIGDLRKGQENTQQGVNTARSSLNRSCPRWLWNPVTALQFLWSSTQ